MPLGLGIFQSDDPDDPGDPDDPSSLLAHAPSRSWFGEVLPGTYAPNIDVEGVDGKLAGVATIQKHDPGFAEGGFLPRAQRVFFVVLQAWTSLHPELSQGVMGPKIWEQQKAQAADFRSKGWLNQLDRLSLTSANIAGAASGGQVDTVTVRLNASCADYVVDSAGRILRGTLQPVNWTEDWIFQRPASQVTAPSGSMVAQQCPNCGAPVPVDITTLCPFCKAGIISGTFGWALTRIDRVL